MYVENVVDRERDGGGAGEQRRWRTVAHATARSLGAAVMAKQRWIWGDAAVAVEMLLLLLLSLLSFLFALWFGVLKG